MDRGKGDCTLGIDLGTTSVKILLLDKTSGQIISAESVPTKADIDVGDCQKSEQNVGKIYQVVNDILGRFPAQLKDKVKYIGVSGQMHGVVLWKPQPYQWDKNKIFSINNKLTTNLITWQDKRLSKEFLDSLPDTGQVDKLCCGFGLPTLLSLLKSQPEIFQQYNLCGTVQDLLVAILTGTTEKPFISDQNASGWGFYNPSEMKWKDDLLKSMGFPTNILPEIRITGSPAGKLKQSWSHIPEGCVVGVAAGDMLTSVHSIFYNKEQELADSAIINISTSIQLAFVLPPEFDINQVDERYTAVEYRPYFGGRFLAAGAGLNAGNCLAFFVQTLKDWMKKFGADVAEDKIWEILLKEGRKQAKTDLIIEPTLRGERYTPDKTASVTNLHMGNLDLGHIMRALCSGIVNNLENLLPRDMLKNYGIKRIYITGSALLRNEVLQQEIREVFKEFQVENCDSGDAAYGAAVLGISK